MTGAAARVARRCGWLFTAAVIGVASGCASSGAPAPKHPPAASEYSGFLSDYSQLRPDPADPEHRSYAVSVADLRQYHKFIVDSPLFMVKTTSGFQPIDPKVLTQISDYYVDTMSDALRTHYQVVQQPGPQVARIRVALVGVTEVKTPLKVRDFIPVKALFDVSRKALGREPYLVQLSIEGELQDSVTHAPIASMVDVRRGDKTKTRDASIELKQVKDIIDFLVKRAVARLDKANGYTS